MFKDLEGKFKRPKKLNTEIINEDNTIDYSDYSKNLWLKDTSKNMESIIEIRSQRDEITKLFLNSCTGTV